MGPEQVIRQEYGDSPNFMTPKVEGYGWLVPGKIAYELSSGTGFDSRPIFGISVAELLDDGTTERRRDLSTMEEGRNAALRRIGELKHTFEEGA